MLLRLLLVVRLLAKWLLVLLRRLREWGRWRWRRRWGWRGLRRLVLLLLVLRWVRRRRLAGSMRAIDVRRHILAVDDRLPLGSVAGAGVTVRARRGSGGVVVMGPWLLLLLEMRR